jgi:FtsH-binding integral membrane protein
VFVSAASFAALGAYGHAARRVMAPASAFVVMGGVGLVAAGLADAVLAGPPLQLVTSVAGVGAFAALTAWDIGRLRREYVADELGGELAERSAARGALSLYLNFINIFSALVVSQRERVGTSGWFAKRL